MPPPTSPDVEVQSERRPRAVTTVADAIAGVKAAPDPAVVPARTRARLKALARQSRHHAGPTPAQPERRRMWPLRTALGDCLHAFDWIAREPHQPAAWRMLRLSAAMIITGRRRDLAAMMYEHNAHLARQLCRKGSR